MPKYIPITKCSTCPNVDHNGAFAGIAYVPVCRAARRELPYTVGVANGRAVASTTGEVPEWCPLPDLPETLA